MSDKSEIRDTIFTLIKKFWFLVGLILISALTLFDHSETVSGTGRWFKVHYGPEITIFLIFFCSGLLLNAKNIKSGVTDVKCMLITLVLIFLVSPMVAVILSMLPLGVGIKIGIFLVAVMPPTLSSNVVMTGAAGGRIAQALVTTIMTNCLCVFTIPLSLSLLLTLVRSATVVRIDIFGIMFKIGVLLVLPLCGGLITKVLVRYYLDRYEAKLHIINQLFVLGIVWMALSPARNAVIDSGTAIWTVSLLVFLFHGMLLWASGLLIRYFQIEKGRREGIIFVGCQKTLPLAVVLQVSLFPMYGLALVVCVAHHIIHLLMDAYLVSRLKEFD